MEIEGRVSWLVERGLWEDLKVLLIDMRIRQGDAFVAALLSAELKGRVGRQPAILTTEVLRDLFAPFGANLNVKEERYGLTLAHVAARGGDHERLSFLLQHGATLNDCPCKRGRLPIHYAAIKGSAACITSLLANGSRVNVQDNDGFSPLHHAVYERDDVEVVKLLANAGIDVDLKESRKQRTAAQIAADMERVETTRWFEAGKRLKLDSSFVQFLLLPAVLQSYIATFLPVRDACALASCNRALRTLLRTPSFASLRWLAADGVGAELCAAIPGLVFFHFSLPLGGGGGLSRELLLATLSARIPVPPYGQFPSRITDSGTRNAVSLCALAMDEDGERASLGLVGLLQDRMCVSGMVRENLGSMAMNDVGALIDRIVKVAWGHETFVIVNLLEGGHSLCGDMAFIFVDLLAQVASVLFLGGDRMYG